MRTVSAVWAAEQEAAEAGGAAREWSLEDRLREGGFGSDDIAVVEEVLEAEAQARAIDFAAGFLRELRQRLKTESAAGAAVARVLGDPAAGADLAEKLGVSKQAVLAVVSRLRPIFADLNPALRPANFARPDLPGTWLTCPEIRAAVGISVDRLTRLGARSVRCVTRNFWEEGQVRRRLEEIELEAASRRAGR